MIECVHCGLPANEGCASHAQSVPRRRKKVTTVKARDPKDEQSIHPRVRGGRTVFPKSNTAKPKRGK